MTEETRQEVWRAGKGCEIEDLSRSVATYVSDEDGGRIEHPRGVVQRATTKWFEILWDSGRVERVRRDFMGAPRHKKLRVIPKR